MNDHLLPRIYRKPASYVQTRYVCSRIANWLATFDTQHHYRPYESSPTEASIRVICISDTHNRTPELPAGDILIHAGDLTQNGSFAELQAQLDWLGMQPHRFKVVIGGNHDLFLDQNLSSYRRALHGTDSHTNIQGELDWRGCHYLKDDCIYLEFPELKRIFKIFGSPMTPECGDWAFQYPAIRDVWSKIIPNDCDIVISHCPPALHRDGRGGIGDGYLLKEIRRVKPALIVVGHAHDGYGVDDIWHEGCQPHLDDIALNHQPLWALMAIIWVFLQRLLFDVRPSTGRRKTIVANAAIATSGEQRRRNCKTPHEIFL